MKNNNLVKRTLIAASIVGVTFSTFSVAAQERVRLNFGVYSSSKPTAMVRTFKPVLNALETLMAEKLNTDVDIRMQIAKSYEQGVSDLTTGKVDFSRFGPASYIEAKRENAGLNILAIESINSEKVFYGIIAVKADSDIETLDQLRKPVVCFWK